MSKLNIILALTVVVTAFYFEPHAVIAGPHDLVELSLVEEVLVVVWGRHGTDGDCVIGLPVGENI